MKETYTPQDSASSAASSSHEKQDSYCATPPVVLQDIPEDDDEPPIRPPTGASNHHNLGSQENPDITKFASHVSTDVYSTSSGTSFVVEKRPFDRDAIELAQYLHTSLSSGLDDSEALNRLKLHGKNLLKGQGKVSIWAVLWRQVSNAMTAILLGALAIAFATQDFAEGAVITGIFLAFRAFVF